MRTALWVAMGLSCLAAGCPGSGGDGGGGDSSASLGSPPPASEQAQADACGAVEACGVDRSECETLFDLAVLGADCATEIETAPCEDHALASPPFLDVCFPPCSTARDRCDGGDLIFRCTDNFDGTLRQAFVRCADVCAARGSTWSGECGSSYMGQQSGSGGDVCWCL